LLRSAFSAHTGWPRPAAITSGIRKLDFIKARKLLKALIVHSIQHFLENT